MLWEALEIAQLKHVVKALPGGLGNKTSFLRRFLPVFNNVVASLLLFINKVVAEEKAFWVHARWQKVFACRHRSYNHITALPTAPVGQNPVSIQINGKIIILFQYVFVMNHWGFWVLWIQIRCQQVRCYLEYVLLYSPIVVSRKEDLKSVKVWIIWPCGVKKKKKSP